MLETTLSNFENEPKCIITINQNSNYTNIGLLRCIIDELPEYL